MLCREFSNSTFDEVECKALTCCTCCPFNLALQDSLVEIPSGWQLRLCNAVIKPDKAPHKSHSTKTSIAAAFTTVWVELGEEEEASGNFAFCSISRSNPFVPCTGMFSWVDNPITFKLQGPETVHLTGYYERDPYMEDSDEEGGSDYDEGEVSSATR